MDLDDERAQLEAELARLDAERSHRISHDPAPATPKDTALADLESRLSELEFEIDMSEATTSMVREEAPVAYPLPSFFS